ncbi:MAG: hypothetical protein U1F57_05280 [bacterium]
MKKNFVRFPIMWVLFFLFLASTVQAQTDSVRRLKFQRGHSSAVVRGNLSCDQTVTYLVGAKAGQKMSVHLSGKGAAYRLGTPNGGALQGGKAVNRSTDDLDESGDYKISVECWKQAASSYELEVVIQ